MVDEENGLRKQIPARGEPAASYVAAIEARMKAVTYERFGGPERLRYGEAEKPVPGDGEVLVRVRAASVNPSPRKE